MVHLLVLVPPGRGVCEMFAALVAMPMQPDPAVIEAITARHGVTLRR